MMGLDVYVMGALIGCAIYYLAFHAAHQWGPQAVAAFRSWFPGTDESPEAGEPDARR